MASAGGKGLDAAVEAGDHRHTPSTVNSLLSVRLARLMESWLALMPVASPPEETPAVSDRQVENGCDSVAADSCTLGRV